MNLLTFPIKTSAKSSLVNTKFSKLFEKATTPPTTNGSIYL